MISTNDDSHIDAYIVKEKDIYGFIQFDFSICTIPYLFWLSNWGDESHIDARLYSGKHDICGFIHFDF